MMIVAEIGMNHGGSTTIADELLERSINAGVDCISFQIPRPTGNKGQPAKTLTLPNWYYISAARYANSRKRKFCIVTSDEHVLHEVTIDYIKILSRDWTNTQLISSATSIATTYLSTSFMSLADVVAMHQDHKQLSFIHTALSYDITKANLSCIVTMRRSIGDIVGFGLHYPDRAIAIASVMYRPESIWFYVKHKDVENPIDDAHAIDIERVREFVAQLRLAKEAIGNGIKLPVRRTI